MKTKRLIIMGILAVVAIGYTVSILPNIRHRAEWKQTAVINAEIRESTRNVGTLRSYQQNTVRRGVLLSLGTRIGFPPQTTIKRFA